MHGGGQGWLLPTSELNSAFAGVCMHLVTESAVSPPSVMESYS